MINFIFETHSTSLDNEAHRVSGHFDTDLSPCGIEQAKKLGERYKGQKFDAIFCSDLKRSYNTASIAFKDYGFIKDSRLRECNYGDMTHAPSEKIQKEQLKRISEPFPNGESYKEVVERVKNFLIELLCSNHYKRILIIGHRGTWYAIEHLLNKKSLQDVINTEWQWQPGWIYELKEDLKF